MSNETARPLTDALFAAPLNAACRKETSGILGDSADSARFDAVKVAAVRLAIQNGEFRMDAETIADKMILQGHLG